MNLLPGVAVLMVLFLHQESVLSDENGRNTCSALACVNGQCYVIGGGGRGQKYYCRCEEGYVGELCDIRNEKNDTLTTSSQHSEMTTGINILEIKESTTEHKESQKTTITTAGVMRMTTESISSTEETYATEETMATEAITEETMATEAITENDTGETYATEETASSEIIGKVTETIRTQGRSMSPSDASTSLKPTETPSIPSTTVTQMTGINDENSTENGPQTTSTLVPGSNTQGTSNTTEEPTSPSPCPQHQCENGGICRPKEGTGTSGRTLPDVGCLCFEGYFGEYCQYDQECGPGYYHVDDECKPCPLATYSSEPDNERCLNCQRGYTTPFEGATRDQDCYQMNSTTAPNDNGTTLVTTTVSMTTAETETIPPPYIESFNPTFGPIAGGTLVTVKVKNLNYGKVVSISIGQEANCSIIQQNPSKGTILCETSEVLNQTESSLELLFDDGLVVNSSDTFTYMGNPVITAILNLKTFVSGGIVVTVKGRNLNAISKPLMIVTMVRKDEKEEFPSECNVVDPNTMGCPTPNLMDALKVVGRRRREVKSKSFFESIVSMVEAISGSQEGVLGQRSLRSKRAVASSIGDKYTNFYIGFKLDGMDTYNNMSDTMPEIGKIEVYPDPVYHEFDEENGLRVFDPEVNFLHIKGKNLNYASRLEDINVTIGKGQCVVTFLATNQLTCKPPFNQPEYDVFHHQGAPMVRVFVGSLHYVIGYLKYKDDNTHVTIFAIVGTLAAILIITSLVCLLCVMRRKKMEKKKQLARTNSNYDDRPNNMYSTDYTLPPIRRLNTGPTQRQQSNFSDTESVFSARNSTIPLVMNTGTPSQYDSPNSKPLQQDYYENPTYGGPNFGGRSSMMFDVMEVIDEDLQFAVKECLVDSDRLVLAESIGKGYFGQVFKGVFSDADQGNPTTVAVKTVQGSTCSVKDITSFLQEAVMMKDFSHVNVLALLGVVMKENKPYVILPYMENGDLRTYISDSAKQVTVRQLLQYGMQITDGMSYLAEQKFVHRDLATRNCMMNNKMVVKIADFGLSRDIYKGDYYRVDDMRRPLPIKWMAIESLTDGLFTVKTDVWSFGVVLWELMTRGLPPYADVDNFNMKTFLVSGRRLERPSHCPQEVYSIMTGCWQHIPDERPNFDELFRQIKDILNEKSRKDPLYESLV